MVKVTECAPAGMVIVGLIIYPAGKIGLGLKFNTNGTAVVTVPVKLAVKIWLNPSVTLPELMLITRLLGSLAVMSIIVIVLPLIV